MARNVKTNKEQRAGVLEKLFKYSKLIFEVLAHLHLINIHEEPAFDPMNHRLPMYK